MSETNREPSNDHQEDVQDGPRVVDKRRYLNLLTEQTDPGAAAREPERFPTFVEELQSKVRASEERVLEYAERFRESREQMEKEIEAVRERLLRTVDDRVDQARARFIRSVLEVLDNLKRAVLAAEADPTSPGILGGLRAMVTQFEKSLEGEGVVTLNPSGDVFDPNLHEAIDTVSVEPEQDGRVVATLEAGYSIGLPGGERAAVLIRPAKVRVGKSG